MILFGLILISLITRRVPLWVPLLLYFVVVVTRAYVKIVNYRDWLQINARDEQAKLEEIAGNMASQGLASSGARVKEEKKAKEDFEYQRKLAYRKLIVDIVNSFFLK